MIGQIAMLILTITPRGFLFQLLLPPENATTDDYSSTDDEEEKQEVSTDRN
jgi:hypothetical protein